MLGFVIPVKSKKSSSDWKTYCLLFERCIKSVCNQLDSDFEAIVVCHEIPEIDYKNPKIHYLQVDFEAPTPNTDRDLNNHQGEIDKGKKIFEGIACAKKIDADYIMTVDSDDCISNKISKYVNKSKEKDLPGWYVKKGYVYREGSNWTFLNRQNFNDLCGSCIIIKPDLIELMFNRKPYLLFYHQRINLSADKNLKALPFAASLYSVGNGENFYMSVSQAKSLNKHSNFFSFHEIKRIFKKVNKYRPKRLNKSFRKEFMMYKITEA